MCAKSVPYRVTRVLKTVLFKSKHKCTLKKRCKVLIQYARQDQRFSSYLFSLLYLFFWNNISRGASFFFIVVPFLPPPFLHSFLEIICTVFWLMSHFHSILFLLDIEFVSDVYYPDCKTSMENYQEDIFFYPPRTKWKCSYCPILNQLKRQEL